MKALLDTSFLLLCVEKGRDYLRILEEKIGEKIEPIVLENVIAELRMLSKRPGKKALLAKAALEQTAHMAKVQFQNVDDVDEALQKYAAEYAVPIVSVDAKMLKKLSKLNLPYMTIGRAGKPIVRLILR